MEVECSARHAGGSSDAVDLRGAYADLAKFSQCRLEESFPRLGTLSRSQALFSRSGLIRVAFREGSEDTMLDRDVPVVGGGLLMPRDYEIG